jgi:hypothetical protein
VHRLDTKADGEFRTVIAVIPSVGHFYCARERRQDITAGQERIWGWRVCEVLA